MSAKRSFSLFAAAVCLIGCGALVSRADTHYVWRDNPAPEPDYTNGWASAATNIQLAVDASVANDVVLVTNGTYDTGGAVDPHNACALTNRVYVDKAITIRSMNGPKNTIIMGKPDDATGTNGNSAIRCVCFYNANVVLIGFTLTNGHTRATGPDPYDQVGGGILLNSGGPVISNCVITGCTARDTSGYGGGGAHLWNASWMRMISCIVSNNTSANNAGGVATYGGGLSLLDYCTVVNNTAANTGGGVCSFSQVNNCTIAGNRSIGEGGGMTIFGTVSNCVISGNVASGSGRSGGGADLAGVMVNCVVSNNTAFYGGGVYLRNNSVMKNCIVVSNTATGNGGAAYLPWGGCAMINCLLANNVASGSGGGAWMPDVTCGAMTNCTITSNTAASGGGVLNDNPAMGVVGNCVIWGNTGGASSNVAGSGSAAFTYTCSGPVQAGTGNTGVDPQFADANAANYRLRSNSPCVNSGLNQGWMTNSVDLDGRIRIRYGTVDMGAYETIYKGTVFSF